MIHVCSFFKLLLTSQILNDEFFSTCILNSYMKCKTVIIHFQPTIIERFDIYVVRRHTMNMYLFDVLINLCCLSCVHINTQIDFMRIECKQIEFNTQ